MAFCNACGANIVPGTRFCSKCGAPILASSLPTPAASSSSSAATSPPTVPAPAPVAPSTGGALKPVLIVIGVVVLVGILCVISLGIFAVRMAHRTRVHQDGDNVRVETPFGTVQTTKDPQEAARNLGVDVYPGARILDSGAASTTFGAVHTSALSFETSDSVDQVCNFYKTRFPNAMVSSIETNQCSIVSNDQKKMISISVTAEHEKTHIAIANVSRASGSTKSSSN